jgi:LysM repeat protein
LAGTVIYSTRHLLEDPYKVLRGEKLEEVAQRYKIPPRLLQNINGLSDPSLVLPGTELKVLRGPFRAEVDTTRGELTLFLGSLYAGRFTIQAGSDPAPRPGKYDVLDIQPGHTYISSAGQAIPAGNSANPYGQWWIDLGGDLCIHGAPDSGTTPGAGCLGLSPRDAADVAAILSVGSKIVIR